MTETPSASDAQADDDVALVDALAGIVGRERTLTSGPDRLAYGRDCWPRNILRVRDGDLDLARPAAIVQPGTEQAVRELVRLAERRGLALIPYGAGSGVCGGAVPTQAGTITVDLKRLRHVELDAARGLARVGPGAIGQHVEQALLRRGHTLGHYPSSLYCSSIGGYLAARSAGQYSSRYGKIEDMVEGVRAVVGGGEVVDTAAVARDGGPDLLPLLVGSEGTLGVITDSALRVWPAPQARAYRGWMMPGVGAGVEAIRQLMRAGLRPAVVRLYDELDTLLGNRKHQQATVAEEEGASAPGMTRRLLARAREALGTSVAGEALSTLVHRTSQALMGRVLGQPLLVHGLARLAPGGACMMIVGFEGQADEVALEAAYASEVLGRHGEDMGPGPGEHWHENRFNVSYKQSPTMDTGAFVDTMEVATSWSNLLTLYEAVRRATSPHAVTLAHFSHAYLEGCSIYFTFAGFAPEHEALLARYDRVWASALEAVASSGAAITHHHGVGQSKAAFTGRDQRGGRPLFDALKAALDPWGVFNPGKVWLTSDGQAPRDAAAASGSSTNE